MSTFIPCAGLRVAAASLALCAAASQAQTPPAEAPADERGFSYFMGFGAQRLTYRETPSIVPAQSKAETTNPMLISGAVYAVNADTLLALDSEASFAPGTTTERWTATASAIGGTPVNNPLLQTNRFSLQETKTRLLLHYRLHDQWFVTGGPSFQTQSFKRFGFVAGPDNLVALPADRTVEESASEVLLHVGAALESERVRNAVSHHSVRVSVGVPVWRRLENTAFPDHSFNGTKGYELSLAGRYSRTVVPNVQLGVWGQWSHSQRGAQVQGNVELPEFTLRGLAGGIELLWKL